MKEAWAHHGMAWMLTDLDVLEALMKQGCSAVEYGKEALVTTT